MKVGDMMRKMTGNEFDVLVDFFDRMVQTKWLSEIHTKLKSLTGSWSGLSVLDVGCGTGRLLMRGIEEAKSVTGVDLSKEMVKKSIINTDDFEQKSHFIVGDACNLPFDNGKFDLSLSTCVLFLLPNPVEGMQEMIRVTKSGGRIVMLNPASNMSEREALNWAEKHQLNGEEQNFLSQWAKVSTMRHRYNEEQLTNRLQELDIKKVDHYKVLDGLALITIAQK